MWNQNKIINEGNIVFCFMRSSVLLVSNLISVEQVVSTVKNRISEANWKILKSPQKFIPKVFSTLISKATLSD